MIRGNPAKVVRTDQVTVMVAGKPRIPFYLGLKGDADSGKYERVNVDVTENNIVNKKYKYGN